MLFFLDDILSARLGTTNRVTDSTYETEKETGRGHRRRAIPAKFRDASVDEEDDETEDEEIRSKPPPEIPQNTAKKLPFPNQSLL